ncbi:4-alpha-glucanotransferase [Pseudoalteromonas denitrificans]|uniref:4-alpha-glucanotransferase n=1 Tax=Pseudoalteromonas denitrificans DSM 6059 TaxID=1123010 RepID=A0A1I1PQV0_9GAMM|nr:4-alpha-glucanotransferase [Pseudoalteromonas denitrificans]SFD12294.1 4-alpha-glucanotransferase [Pseudoalteromonas denitrificans DSM 6059]
MHTVEQLLYLQGVGADYTSYNGEHVTISENARYSILKACGYDLTDNASLSQTNFNLDIAPWFKIIHSCNFVSASNNILKIKVSEMQSQSQILWTISQNNQLVSSGSTDISQLNEVGNYTFEDQYYSELGLELAVLPIGYYDIEVSIDSAVCSGELIIYPCQVFQPLHDKCWGVSVQLYSLKTQDNYGIGDFNDLKSLISSSAEMGADYILLNPLHALFDTQPDRASPYSPSDRLFLNPLYIHIQNVAEFKYSSIAKILVDQHFKCRLFIAEKNETYINYALIWDYKFKVFIALFNTFLETEQKENTLRYQEFEAFKSQKGAQLSNYCIWFTQQENLKGAYQNPNFIAYLQWQAQVQLEQCQSHAKNCKMKLGLIRDLAVGCAQDGNEFNENESLFIADASIGAPPDPWSTAGQNWGLPPMDPVKLTQTNFKHFIGILRANMMHCGALRIDHVMALMRLWWCILHESSNNLGCYVYYPFEKMLALLKLESQLNQCTVIGEDLGVVPVEVKTALSDSHIYSNLLFYFEKNHLGEFIAPHEFTPHSLMMVANHDVPTFKAWWQQSDLMLRNNLNLFESKELFENAKRERVSDKTKLINWLNQYSNQKVQTNFNNQSDYKYIYQNLLIVLAHSPIKLLTVQLDDLDGNALPVNIPGTDKQYPNWRRRLSNSPSKLFSENEFFNQINRARNNHE